MVDSILDSLIESGAVTEIKILASLHKSGVVNVVKLITEAIENTKAGIENGNTAKLVRLGKVDEVIRHWEVIREIISMEEDDGIEDCDISTPEEVTDSTVRVMV